MRLAFALLAAAALLAACARTPSNFSYAPPAAARSRLAATPKSRAGPPPDSRSRPPTRWPPTRATRCSRPAARPSTRRSPCRWCSRWSSRSPAASAAAPSCCTTTARTSRPSMAARPRPRRPTRSCSSARTASPWPFDDAVVGGRSVGVPGAVRMLEMAHKQYGKLPWAKLFEPAIALAEGGFKVSPRLNALVKADAAPEEGPGRGRPISSSPTAMRATSASTLRNPELAAVLRRIAAEGSKALYEGEIAQAIVDKVQNASEQSRQAGAGRPGRLPAEEARADVPRLPAKAGDYRICGFPPPSSGAIAVGQILGILEHTALRRCRMPLRERLARAPTGCTCTCEASRLAFADRGQYVGDPDFVQPPAGGWMSLLDAGYLAERARLIGPQSMKAAQPGAPGRREDQPCAHARTSRNTAPRTSASSTLTAMRIAMTTTIETSSARARWSASRADRRLPAEQRTDRLQLRAGRRARQARRQPRAARQAAALVDGTRRWCSTRPPASW